MRAYLFTFTTAVTLLFGAPANGDYQQYTFTRIADSSTFGNLGDGAYLSVNSAGTVAFYATNAGGAGIFTGSGGPVTTIAQGSQFGNYFALGGAPAINAEGTVTFLGGLSGGGVGLFTGSGGPLTLIASNVNSQFTGFAEPSINNSRAVSFVAGFGANQGVFSAQAGQFTRIADNISRFDGFINNRVAMNADGSVAFYARFPRQVGNMAGVFVGNGGPLTTIADTTSGPFVDFIEGPTINDAGAVAFLAATNGGQGVFSSTDGVLRSIADTSGVFSLFVNASINDAGSVAFLTYLRTGYNGIFTGQDPIADRVIASGDPLFGSSLQFISTRIAQNGNGQIAFVATLADGRTSLVRGDPIPEPSTVLLISIGGLGLLAYAWRRRHPLRIS